jgi:hypothetical protein
MVGLGSLLWTGTRDNVPRLETVPVDYSERECGLSPEVTQIISQGAYSLLVRFVTGVNRYDGT